MQRAMFSDLYAFTMGAAYVRQGTAAYTLVITNSGPIQAIETELVIQIPAGLSLNALPAGCHRTGSDGGGNVLITCDAGLIDAGSSVSFTINVYGSGELPRSLGARVSGPAPDLSPANNSVRGAP